MAVLFINSAQYAIVFVLSRFGRRESKYTAWALRSLGVPAVDLTPEERDDELKALRGGIFTKVISFTNIIYMTLTRYIVGSFVCMDIKEGLQVLRAYPDIECYSELHHQIMAVGGVGLVVYVLGFPLAVLFSLYRIGSKQHHSVPSRLRKYGLVYDRYETHAYAAAPVADAPPVRAWPPLRKVRRTLILPLRQVVLRSDVNDTARWLRHACAIQGFCTRAVLHRADHPDGTVCRPGAARFR